MRLAGKVTVVTGAASGIGRALCHTLGREGAVLGLLDRNAEGLASLAQELEAAGVRCARATADVRERHAVWSAIGNLTEQLGPVDILVTSAGVTGITLLDEQTIADTEAMIHVNLLGMAYAIDAVLSGMLARHSGQIVGICSMAGCRGMAFSAAYCASKAAVARYLEGLRAPLRRRGIAVTTVYPGFVRTPLMETVRMKPPMPMMEPEAAARHIVKAIRGRRRVYFFPWGLGLAVRMLCWLPPGIYDWLMSRGADRLPELRY